MLAVLEPGPGLGECGQYRGLGSLAGSPRASCWGLGTPGLLTVAWGTSRPHCHNTGTQWMSLPWHGASKDPTVTTWRPHGSPPGHLCCAMRHLQTPLEGETPSTRTHGDPHRPPDPLNGAIPPQANTCPVSPCPAGPCPRRRCAPSTSGGGRGNHHRPRTAREEGGLCSPFLATCTAGSSGRPSGSPGTWGGHRGTAQPDAFFPLSGAGANSC